MPAVDGAQKERGGLVAGMDAALGRIGAAVFALLPRRARRMIERIERRQGKPYGQYAATGFLALSVGYGIAQGGHAAMLGEAALVAAGFGVERLAISGHAQTTEVEIAEALGVGRRPLTSLDAGEARDRLLSLPWVSHATVRKLYPGTVEIKVVERAPFALWQHDGAIQVVSRDGQPIIRYTDRRLSVLPLVVGEGANETVAEFWPKVMAEPVVAERMRSAVRVANRRWNLHLENGVTVKLPEHGAETALARLAQLEREQGLLGRDVIVVDLRLLDRVTVRLPEGQPAAGEVKAKKPIKVAGART